MVITGVGQLLSISALYKHRCLESIKKLYRSTVKYDDQKKYKEVLESSKVSTLEIFTENIQMSCGPPATVKKTN